MSLLRSRGAAAFPIAHAVCAGDIAALGDITTQPGLVSGLLPWAGASQEPAEQVSKARRAAVARLEGQQASRPGTVTSLQDLADALVRRH